MYVILKQFTKLYFHYGIPLSTLWGWRHVTIIHFICVGIKPLDCNPRTRNSWKMSTVYLRVVSAYVFWCECTCTCACVCVWCRYSTVTGSQDWSRLENARPNRSNDNNNNNKNKNKNKNKNTKKQRRTRTAAITIPTQTDTRKTSPCLALSKKRSGEFHSPGAVRLPGQPVDRSTQTYFGGALALLATNSSPLKIDRWKGDSYWKAPVLWASC